MREPDEKRHEAPLRCRCFDGVKLKPLTQFEDADQGVNVALAVVHRSAIEIDFIVTAARLGGGVCGKAASLVAGEVRFSVLFLFCVLCSVQINHR